MSLRWFPQLESLQPVERPDADHCTLFPMTDFGLIRVRGEDARDFLQGQLTNDIRQVTPERAQLSAYCTPKGRMLALFLVFQHGEDLYLQLPRERLEPVLQRLRMFVLRARVELEDAGGELALAGLAGDPCGDLLPALPEAPFSCRQEEGITLVRLPGEPARVELVGEPSALAGLLQGRESRLRRGTEALWALLDIRAGLPWVREETAEAFVPQMCNLDLLDGISFTKGCYTGQEVVARMKYLGQLKRRMYLARLEQTPCPAPGEKLFSPASTSAQGAGRVVDARPSPEGGCELLVVAEIQVAESGELRLGNETGPRLELHPLATSEE